MGSILAMNLNRMTWSVFQSGKGAKMASITGGTIKFGRKTVPGQYENAEAVVELSFSLAEGELLGDLLHEVAAQAKNKALEMVGLKAGTAYAPKTKEVYGTGPAMVAVKEQVVKNETKTKEAYAAKKAEEAALKPVDDLTSFESVEQGDDPDEVLFKTTVKEITDQELVAAVTRKNQEIKNPKAIHAVRETFVKLPKGLRDIEQKDRPDFLAKLGELK
jgi:hypothetical protein